MAASLPSIVATKIRGDRVQIRVQVGLEHGVFFLYDAYEDPEIPPDTGAAPFTFTDSCICFWAEHYVDGEADVILSDQPFSAEVRPPDFMKQISIPSGHITLADADPNYYCILRVKGKSANISIWNSEIDNRRASWVQISDLDIFM
jgi:hypothetical protein